MVFMTFMVAIISGISATICGIRVSSRSISGMISLDVVGHLLMPSRVSNTDRIAQQTGMS